MKRDIFLWSTLVKITMLYSLFTLCYFEDMVVVQKNSKLIFSLFSLLFFIFLVFSLFSGLKKRAFKGVDFGNLGNAEVKIKQLSFSQVESGQVSWTLDATEAALTSRGAKALLENVVVTIPYGNAKTLRLQGDEGFVDSKKKEFSLWKKSGLMSIELDQGYTLQTSGLSWDEVRREIISQGKAFIYGPKIQIAGNSLRVSLDKQEMTIIGDVKAMVH